MLRNSEPDYSASHNNSISGGGQDAAAQNRNIVLNEPVPSIRNQNNQEGSERKNPLAYLLASANASVDTTNNNQPQ